MRHRPRGRRGREAGSAAGGPRPLRTGYQRNPPSPRSPAVTPLGISPKDLKTYVHATLPVASDVSFITARTWP